MIWLTAVLVAWATWCDVRTREIPDWITLVLLAGAIITTLFGWDELAWSTRLWGALAGFAAGAALFYLGGVGGGDVKLITGMGAALGMWQLLPVLFWMALAGAVLAVIAAQRGQREFAYGPAIAIGFAIWLVFGSQATPVPLPVQ